MDFQLTDEQQAIRETATRFAAEKLAPHYAARERGGVLDRDLVEQMGSLGLIGAGLPPEYGGLGASGVTEGLIMEDIAYADLNVAYIQLFGSLMGWLISAHARPEVVAEVVPKICAGKVIVGIGLTEPSGGSDAANLKLRARKSGDHYVLNGEKTSISMADQCDQIVVFARTGEQEARAKAISAFLVPTGSPGVTTTRFDDVGSNAVGRGSVFFEDVTVSEELMIGRENEAFRAVMTGFDFSRALIGLQCLGPARASLQEAWAYASEREAFGAPIVRNQGVSEPLAMGQTQLEGVTLLCYKTLWLRDQGLPHNAEAAMCKWWAPQVAFEIIHQCLLTHGHLGYSKDLPIQQRLRDVLGLQIGDGTRQIQKMIIARNQVGRSVAS